MKQRFPVLALTMLVFAALAAASAVAAASADADAEEIGAYRLSTATMTKAENVVRGLTAVAAKDPAFRAKLSSLEDSDADDSEGDEDADPKSLSEIVAVMDSVPEFKKVLAAAGLTSREYLVFTFALFQAGLADALLGPDGKPAPGASPVMLENLAWVRANRAEVERLTADWKRLTGAEESEEFYEDDEQSVEE